MNVICNPESWLPNLCPTTSPFLPPPLTSSLPPPSCFSLVVVEVGASMVVVELVGHMLGTNAQYYYTRMSDCLPNQHSLGTHLLAYLPALFYHPHVLTLSVSWAHKRFFIRACEFPVVVKETVKYFQGPRSGSMLSFK